MHTKHIGALQHACLGERAPLQVREDIRAAIDLMNAAKPLDEAAEREHCAQSARKWWNGEFTTADVVDLLLRERAQARAEGMRSSRMFERESARLQENLCAAQAEIERLKHAYTNADKDYMSEIEKRSALEAQLSVAQAEIERLSSAVDSTCGAIRSVSSDHALSRAGGDREAQDRMRRRGSVAGGTRGLLTQLSNLRVAAERASRLGRAEWSEEERQTLRAAAIEASR
jgi:hypothetical protein